MSIEPTTDPWRRLETPRALAIMAVVTAVVAGTVGFWFGYTWPSQSVQVQIALPPGTVITTPGAGH